MQTLKREFLQLAHIYDPDKHNIGGWFMSEKLDGMRAFWDGGISRGKLTIDVPWANTAKDVNVKVSTGLWSRLGKAIFAPDSFLDQLPDYPLDGELYLGLGQFQELVSIVKRHEPDDRWIDVKYMVFDSPSYISVFQDGDLNNTNFKTKFRGIKVDKDWNPEVFSVIHGFLDTERLNWGPQIELLNQYQLSLLPHKAEERLISKMDEVIAKGGEGLMLRHPTSLWIPTRSYGMLKVKKFLDDEGTVLDYNWGLGKLEGLMGACIVEWKGKVFEISGFTDTERTLITDNNAPIGTPGSPVSCHWYSSKFPRGSKITFKYQKLSDTGIPVHAFYLRREG